MATPTTTICCTTTEMLIVKCLFLTSPIHHQTIGHAFWFSKVGRRKLIYIFSLFCFADCIKPLTKREVRQTGLHKSYWSPKNVGAMHKRANSFNSCSEHDHMQEEHYPVYINIHHMTKSILGPSFLTLLVMADIQKPFKGLYRRYISLHAACAEFSPVWCWRRLLHARQGRGESTIAAVYLHYLYVGGINTG